MDLIEKGEYTQFDQFEYNDLDDHAYQVEWTHEGAFEFGKSARAFVHTCQNYNMLYVLHEIPSVRKVDGKYEEYAGRQLYVYHGYQEFNYPKNRGLDDLIGSGGSRYNDSRDAEYICKSRDPSFARAGDYTLGNVYKIKMALFNLETLHYALTSGDS